MASIVQATGAADVAAGGALVERRKVNPLKWWAGVGGAIVALQIYVYGRWLLTGHYVHSYGGVDAIPLWMRISAHVWEVVAWAVMIWGFYAYLYKPLRRKETLSPISIIWLIGGVSIYWMDWATGWARAIGNWNAAFLVSTGSWYGSIPGWLSPNGNTYADISSFGLPLAIGWFGLGVMILVKVLEWASKRWPRMSTAGLIVFILVFASVLDYVVEQTLVLLGLYVYSGAVPELTLFGGHYFQMPFYEPVLFGSSVAIIAVIVHFKDDRGRTIIERGVDRIEAGARAKFALRVLAFFGFINVTMMAYILAFGLITLLPSYTWFDTAVNSHSYLRNGVCGPGTEYACPASGLPMQYQGDGAFHIRPNGDMIFKNKIVGHVDLQYPK